MSYLKTCHTCKNIVSSEEDVVTNVYCGLRTDVDFTFMNHPDPEAVADTCDLYESE